MRITTTLETRKVADLRNHPLNAQVFGELKCDADADEFIASVKTHGILVPLIVTKDGMILSGHRRRQAAAKAGLKEVPVIVRHDLNGGLASDFAWFETNRNREMTTEQRARWYETRVKIEELAAKERQAANLRQGQNVPNGKTAEKTRSGKSKDIAAADAGIDKRTANKAVEVVHAIDEAEAAGEPERAEELRETLNKKSVAEAHRKATGKAASQSPSVLKDSTGRDVDASLSPACSAAAAIESCARKVDQVRREAESLAQSDGGDFIDTTEVNGLAKKLKWAISQARFYTTCPRCDGKGCDRCDQVGWIPHSRKGQLSDEDKSKIGGE